MAKTHAEAARGYEAGAAPPVLNLARDRPTFTGLTDSDSNQGRVPEWLKGAGCKPAGVSLRGFESLPAHISFVDSLLNPHRKIVSPTERRPDVLRRFLATSGDSQRGSLIET